MPSSVKVFTMFNQSYEEKYTALEEFPQEESYEKSGLEPKQQTLSHQLLLLLIAVPILAFLLGASLGSHFPFNINQHCWRRVSQYCTTSNGNLVFYA